MTAVNAPLRLGISAYDLPVADFLALARAADEAGIDSLWLGEHVFHPRHYASEHPGSHQAQHHTGPIVQTRTHLLDPVATLAAAAAVTQRIRLATGILVLPLRHPLLISRALATLDELAPDRITLGVGAGWLAEEFEAIDVDFADRGRRLRESVAIIRACLAGGFVEHHGAVFDFDELQVVEEPARVPIIMGGNGDVALRRAATLGDGWFSSGSLGLEQAVGLRTKLLGLLDERGRSEEDFEMVIRPDRADPSTVAACAAAGFKHVVVWADQVWDPRDPAPVQAEKLRESAAKLMAMVRSER